jgi:hypothetical protein
VPADSADHRRRWDKCGRRAIEPVAPLSPFRYQAQAQRHCPADTVVWLDFRKGIYYFKRQKRYAQGNTGSFVCRDEARSNGYRRSLLGLR